MSKKSYTNDYAGEDNDLAKFIQTAIDCGLEITFRHGPNSYFEFTVTGKASDINRWQEETGFDD